MKFIETPVDTFLACWFKFKSYKLNGYVHIIVNDEVNEPYLFYQFDTTTEYFNYENMAVVNIANCEIIKNKDFITDEEQNEIHRFIDNNKKAILQFWKDGESYELCEVIEL